MPYRLLGSGPGDTVKAAAATLDIASPSVEAPSEGKGALMTVYESKIDPHER